MGLASHGAQPGTAPAGPTQMGIAQPGTTQTGALQTGTTPDGATPAGATPAGRPDAGRAPASAPASQWQSVRILAIPVLLLIGTFALRELAWLVAPLAGTTLIVTLVYPLFTFLRSRRVPGVVSAIALVVATYLSLLVLVGLVSYAITRFASVITDFTEELTSIVGHAEQWLLSIGITAPEASELLDWVEIPAVAGWVVGQIPSVLALGAMAVLVGTALMFQGVEATQVGRRTQLLRQQQPQVFNALELCARRTRTFFGVNTIFAVIVGILDTVLLLIMGIPLALVWGLLAAVCNYVPFLGFWIGLIPPALLALAIHGWGGLALVVVAYLVLNFVITSLLPTKFVSDAVGLSMVVEVVSIVFWAWVLGPLGAILAIPLTVFAKAIFVDANPNAAWLGEIISSKKSLVAADQRQAQLLPRPIVS